MRNGSIKVVGLMFGLVLLFSASVVGVDGNVTWVQVYPSPAPLPRRSGGMVYDSESDLIILYSGRDPSLPIYLRYGDTWTYDVDANTWTNVTPAVSPPPRGSHAKFKYDSESDRAVFFGGKKPGEPFSAYGDTWAYDCNSNTWENKTPAVSPRPCSSHGWAYDSESDRFILYGGMWADPTATGGRGTQRMTWAYDYNSNTWTNMSPAIDPDLLYTCWMDYDSESDRIILFGGKFRNDSFEEQRDETWAYDFNSNTWTNMNPSVAPPRRNRHSLIYHAGWDRIVLFGGDRDNPSIYYSDTWVYDYNTNTWTELSPQAHPSSRIYGDMAYDSESEKIVLFGGVNAGNYVFGDTWILPGTAFTPDPLGGILLIIGVASVVIIVIAIVVWQLRKR
jgi:hypothetical protein